MRSVETPASIAIVAEDNSDDEGDEIGEDVV